jgi:hypothetical protein
MEYEAQLMPLNKCILGPNGLSMPLCNDCQTPDCTNPIRERLVSIRGIAVNMRVWVSHDILRQVVMCKGYVGANDVAISEDERTADDDGYFRSGQTEDK